MVGYKPLMPDVLSLQRTCKTLMHAFRHHHQASCYVLGAEYWASQGGMQQAHSLLERMRLTKVPSEPYVEAATVEAIYKVRCVWHGPGISFVMKLCHTAENTVAFAVLSCPCDARHGICAAANCGHKELTGADACHAGSRTASDSMIASEAGRGCCCVFCNLNRHCYLFPSGFLRRSTASPQSFL